MTTFAAEVKTRQLVAALTSSIANMEGNVNEAVQRTAIETGRKLKAGAPSAFSTLINSINEEQIDPMAWRTGPHVDYAEAVEKGTSGGGFVPFRTIFSWVKTKGIQPLNPEWNQTDLAWVIQKKILMKGTPAQPFVQPVVDSGFPQQRLQQLVDAAADLTMKQAGL